MSRAASYDSCSSCAGQCSSASCKWLNTGSGASNYSNCGIYGCYTGGCYLGCIVDCNGTCFSGCSNTSNATNINSNQQTLSCGGACVSGAFCKSSVKVDPATCDGLATS